MEWPGSQTLGTSKLEFNQAVGAHWQAAAAERCRRWLGSPRHHELLDACLYTYAATACGAGAGRQRSVFSGSFEATDTAIVRRLGRRARQRAGAHLDLVFAQAVRPCGHGILAILDLQGTPGTKC